ncbi:hypothetical protein INH39_08105 [Massilia violaceinigra]|uniref:Uncharacterized protein n=1 Tax=Massilia violaceinigra TaxID=2045208 RepID=A0ABY4AD84_9BURK|nr:hypothetical protein [Massilia violaceinigra]UOD31634.1 hypothetical protein INH39_08105 [Massilia violaceinigra]
MFQFQEVVDALKAAAANDPHQDISYCRLLNMHAQAWGYQSYNHFLHSLRNLPSEQFGKVSLKLMRLNCMRKLPSLDVPYFEFQAYSPNQISFYSEWAGWDKRGDEVRVPRKLCGRETATGLRKLAPYPVYVVESLRELLAWRYNWHSTALIPEKLAKEFFAFAFNKTCLVEKNPPIDLIEGKIGAYANNMARVD